LEAEVLRHHLGGDPVEVARAAYRPQADPHFLTNGPKTRRDFLNLMRWTGGNAT